MSSEFQQSKSLLRLFITRVITVLILFFHLSSLTQAEEINFVQAWQRVQGISNVLAAEQANVERSRLMQEAVKGLYLPQIELTGTYTRLDQAVELDILGIKPISGLGDSTVGQDLINLLGGEAAFTTQVTNESFGRAGISLLWPLYTGGRITATQDISAAQTEVAVQLQDTQRRIIFEELVNVYFGVVLANQNLSIHQQAQAGLQLHLNDAQALEEQGQIAAVERLAVQAAHDRSRVETDKARSKLEISEIMLQQLLHQDASIIPADSLFTNPALPAAENFVRATLNSSPALKMLTARATEAQAMISAERGSYRPEVFLFADYTAYEDNSLASELSPDWLVGVGVTLPLMARIKRSKVIGASIRAKTAITELSLATERALSVTAQVAYRETDQSLEEYSGLHSSVALAIEALRIRRESFNQGFSTSVELVDAQLFLAEVQTAQSAAAYSYITSLAQLLVLSGNIPAFNQYQQNGLQHHSTGVTP